LKGSFLQNLIGKTIVLTAAVAAVLGGSASAMAANASTVRPHTAASASASTLTPFVQDFSTTTSPFCPTGSGNVPCDGAVGDYGTITRAAAGSNGIPALAKGEPDYAMTAGSQATSTGCPSTATEYCTGPYALFDGGQLATFPAQGYTVTADLYLNPADYTGSNTLNADIGLNTNEGAYLADVDISVCPVAGGLAVNSTNGSPGACGTTANVTAAGWYRFVWDFQQNAQADAVVTEHVISEATGSAVWESTLEEPVIAGQTTPIAGVGGPSYFWIPTEDTNSLALSNFAVQLGSYQGGNAPDTVKATSPEARITVSKAGKYLRVRVHAVSSDGAAITSWTLSSLKHSGLSISKSGLIRGNVVKQRQIITATATDAIGVTGAVSFRLIVK
jgi:hypothetical protein